MWHLLPTPALRADPPLAGRDGTARMAMPYFDMVAGSQSASSGQNITSASTTNMIR
jgi:hypothetical protein